LRQINASPAYPLFHLEANLFVSLNFLVEVLDMTLEGEVHLIVVPIALKERKIQRILLAIP
jgi:hypothetical protein